MLKHFLTAAILGLFLSLSAMSQADAASVSPVTGLDQTQKAIDSTLTPVHGNGWWAVPVVIGGVILFHELHRRDCCCYRTYRRCWWRHGRRYCRRYCR